MAYPEKTERNEKIFDLIEHGISYPVVAATFGISTSRAFQIYNRKFVKKFSSLNLKNKEEKNHGKQIQGNRS